MAAPAHYIRTIHTSFTAAHPRPNAARSQHHQYLHPFTTSINSHNSQLYQQHLQQQHHNHHHRSNNNYNNHHHYLLPIKPSSTCSMSPGGTPTPSPAGAGGRRRAASIRIPPNSNPPSYSKFDPFADEPLLSPTPLSPSSQVNRISYSQNLTYNNRDYHPHHHELPPSSSPSPTPITIHIPPAAPTELKRHSTSQNRRITERTSSSNSGNPPTNGRSTFLGGSTIPSAPVPNLNPSKIVAGILLNRVHAVGKPMRRRLPGLSGPKQYVKSGLSSVVSVEA